MKQLEKHQKVKDYKENPGTGGDDPVRDFLKEAKDLKKEALKVTKETDDCEKKLKDFIKKLKELSEEDD